ncbi:MAG: thioredoxin family protein [Candidatus Aminicenantes bacterium]|nr:MAG: thioredoxin family protein [Candidatus Aminicenantes bacterium]
MKLLNKKVIKELEEIFKGLEGEVTLKFFTQEFECQFCRDTRELLEELSGLTDKIKLDIYDFVADKEEVEKYGIKRIPALVAMDEEDRGIKFYGIPGGYEFGSLIEALKLVSTGETGLARETKDFLDSLDKEVHLQVFVTPTCPYCPGAVILAHRMAFHSPKVTADMIEATEFPELAVKYNVMGVPRTVINETQFQEGPAPEEMLIEKIKAAL